ncbi:MAG: addiction module protein [Anaerolineae bacterium]|nr:addiction module protein [Gemmatimonadaceae bacterium]
MANPAFDYRGLGVADRLQLVGDIWDSIAEEANVSPDVLPLTDEQKAELDRRVAEYDADPSIGVPMDEVLDRIEAKLRRPK